MQFTPEPTQVSKVWDAVPLEKVSKWLCRLEAGFATYTDAYVDRCMVRLVVHHNFHEYAGVGPLVRRGAYVKCL